MGKIKTILTDGLDPYRMGRDNFKKKLPKVEELAKERAEVCRGCPYFKEEPIPMFRVTDNLIPELSGMMCGECGCELPYKTRQSISVCPKWSKKE